MKQFIKYLAIVLCAGLCWSCTDDEIEKGIDYSKPAEVKLSIRFSEMEGVSPNSRAAGNAINNIYDVCVLFYQNGTLARSSEGEPVYIYTGNGLTFSELRGNTDALTVKKTLMPGSYQVVAVANMGNLVEDRLNDVETLAALKAITLTWDEEDITKNSQMFGIFAETATNAIDEAIVDRGGENIGLSVVNPTDEAFLTPVILRGGAQTIYAQLYRAAAKVTVGFDAEQMQERVVVTIESIKICNLPGSTKLWEPTKLDGDMEKALNQIRKGMNLEVRNKGVGESMFPANAHAPESESFFLFENRQGVDANNEVGYRDSLQKAKTLAKMPHGTYLEIKARYDDQTELTGSHGDIIYRYMIGEDIANTFNNYNLTRNRHYKITLVFTRSAKEGFYWRVEYVEDPVINIPSEVRLTYRHAGTFPQPIQFTVNEEGSPIASVKAKITKNPWYDTSLEGEQREAQNIRLENDQLKWGFLCWGDQDRSPSNSTEYSPFKTESRTLTGTLLNEKGSIKRYRYELNLQTEALAFSSDPALTRNAAETFTGYNNYANPRVAEVTVTVTYADATVKTSIVKVIQEPRVVNPIAIYRKAGNADPFHIRLLNAQGREIDSYGPWSAEIEQGADWVRIRREDGTYGTDPITSGAAGGAIRFYYKPVDGGGTEPRCGVIRVAYSNNSVIHRIYVRQGYDPITIGEGDALWTSFNYLGKDNQGVDQFASSPMEEGAWLKEGSTEGILATNYYGDGNYFQGGFHTYLPSYPTSTKESKSWNDLSRNGFTVKEHRLPREEEMKALLHEDHKNLSGFGIGYDDSSTETLAFDEEAQYSRTGMGRRGVVMCDTEGKNIFFPIGKRGYGRIRSNLPELSREVLHYSNESAGYGFETDKGIYRPNLIDLYKAYGAYYRIDGTQQMTFNYSLANIETQGKDEILQDACFARLIKKVGPENIPFSKSIGFIYNGKELSEGVTLTFNTDQAKVVKMEKGSGQATWMIEIAYLETIAMEDIVLTFSYQESSTTMTLKEFKEFSGWAITIG